MSTPVQYWSCLLSLCLTRNSIAAQQDAGVICKLSWDCYAVVCCNVYCGNVQELVPLKREGADADFLLSCSLPVGGLSWLRARPKSYLVFPHMLHTPEALAACQLHNQSCMLSACYVYMEARNPKRLGAMCLMTADACSHVSAAWHVLLPVSSRRDLDDFP